MPVKPFKSYDDQIALLEARGLNVPDHHAAREFLKHHNYYRLSAYRFPFQSTPDQFDTGSSFHDLCNLYRFDRGLRLLVGEACKTLEISVRSRWAYILGEEHNELAYEDLTYFKNERVHNQNLSSLDKEIRRSHEVFISHYRDTHHMPRPPIWAACEVMSFGLLSRFYSNIKHASTRKKIAKTYDMSAGNLSSLLRHCSYLRNLCAHHSRIWNRAFTITVSLPTSQPSLIAPAINREKLSERKIYNSIVILAHIMDTVSPSLDWKVRIKAHLLNLNRPDHSEMGFPVQWEKLDFWQ